MDFFNDVGGTIDLREEMSALLRGRVDTIAQGREITLRRMTNQKCSVCWSKVDGGSGRLDCPYCQGEGWSFTESVELVFMVRGVAPVYKPGNLATGQYPQAEYGYTDPNRATCFIEAVTPDGTETFPDYERYTSGSHGNYDKLYELKVDVEGNTVHPIIHAAKWKLLTVVPYHGDNGRIEYFEIGLQKEEIG